MTEERLAAWLDDGQKVLYTYRWYLVLLGFCALAGYGFTAYNLTLVADDWAVFVDGSVTHELLVQIGRWVLRIISELTQERIFAPTVTLSIFVVLAIIACWLQAQVIGLQRPGSVFIYTALLLFHPFWAESVTFKIKHIGVGVAILLASLTAYLVHRATLALLQDGNRRRGVVLAVLAAVAFSLTASTQQTFIFFAGAAVLFGILNDALQGDSLTTPLQIVHRVGIFAAVVVVGLLLYVIEVNLFMWIYNVPPVDADSSYTLTGSLVRSVDDVQFTLRRFNRIFFRFHVLPTYLMPVVTKYVFLIALGLLAIALVRRPGPLTKVLLLVCLVGVVVMPWSLGLVRLPSNSYRYNALVQISAIYAGVIAVVIDNMRWRVPRLLAGTVAIGMLVVFLHQHNSAALVTYSLNQRDYAIANRILLLLEAHPGYPALANRDGVRLIVVGQLPLDTDRPFRHVNYGTTLGRPFNSVEVGVWGEQPQRATTLLYLLQASDINFGRQAPRYDLLGPNRQAELRPIVADMEPYPSPESVHITADGDVFIMLSEPS